MDFETTDDLGTTEKLPARPLAAGEALAWKRQPRDRQFDARALPTPEEENTRAALDLTQGFSAKRSPEQSAQALELSRETGLPFEDAEQKVAAGEGLVGVLRGKPSWQSLVKDAPVLADRLTDPGVAAAVQDDVENLTGLERWFGTGKTGYWQNVKGAANRGMITRKLANLRWKELMFEATPGDMKEIDTLKKEMEQYPEEKLGYLTGIPTSALESLPIMGQTFVKSLPYAGAGAATGAGVGAAGGAAFGGVGAAPGAIAGGKVGLTAGWRIGTMVESGKVEGGLAYDEIKDIPGVDPDTARKAAFVVGAVNGALEVVGVETIFKAAGGKKLAALLGRDAMVKALKNSTKRQVIVSFFKHIGEAALTEGVTEYLQELSNIVADAEVRQEAATFGERLGIAWKATKENQARALEAGLKGAQGGIGMAGFGGLISLRSDLKAAQAAKDRVSFFEELGKRAKDSTTRERLPEEFRAYVDKLTEKYGPVDAVNVPADKLLALFQKNEIEPEDVRARMPKVADAIEAAQRTKDETGFDVAEEVSIPLADFATNVAGLEGFEGIKEDLRIGDEPTAREAVEIEKKAKEIMKDMADSEKSAGLLPDDSRAIFDDVYNKLTSIGQSDEVASRYATLWTAFSETRAKRIGVSPLEYYKGLGLSISHADLVEAIAPEEKVSTLTSDQLLLREKALKGDEQAMAALEDSLSRDELTGANSQNAWMRLLSQKREGFYLSIDANDLKRVNDLLGHTAGNEFLKFIGQTVGGATRSNKGKFFRSGGDEFAAFWPAAMEAHARSAVEAITKAMNSAPALKFDKGEHRASISVGLGRSFEKADLAATKAKEGARAAGRSGFGRPGAVETQDFSKGDVFFHADDTQTLAQKIDVTSKPEFKKWFGASKVVDESGNPRIVFHGTSQAGFEIFDVSKQDKVALYGPGFYFTEDSSIASEYTEKGQGNKAGVIPVYVKIENPFKVDSTYADLMPLLKRFKAKTPPLEVKRLIDAALREDPTITSPDGFGVWADNTEWAYNIIDKKGMNGEEFAKPYFDYFIEKAIKELDRQAKDGEIPKGAGFGEEAIKFIERNVFETMQDGAQNIQDVLTRLGFDGITHIGGTNVGKKEHRVWIAFKSNQIKSAVGNAGTFDPSNPSILYQPAHHGTKVRGIKQFSTDFMGQGEGAQAYGWGLYFAEKLGIAEDYRRKLAQSVIYFDGKVPESGSMDADIANSLKASGFYYGSPVSFEAARKDAVWKLEEHKQEILRNPAMDEHRKEFYSKAAQQRIDRLNEIKHASHSDSFALPFEETVSLIRERAQRQIDEIKGSEGWKGGEEYADRYDEWLSAEGDLKAELAKWLKEHDEPDDAEFLARFRKLEYVAKLALPGEPTAPGSVRVGDFFDLSYAISRGGEESFGEAIKNFGKDTGIHVDDLVTPPAGQVYKVDVPEKPTLLDRDATWEDQPKPVREKLDKIVRPWSVTVAGAGQAFERFGTKEEADAYAEKARKEGNTVTVDDLADSFTGEDLYNRLKRTWESGEDDVISADDMANAIEPLVKNIENVRPDEAASKYLSTLGVPGLMYLDGTSRKRGQGTHNFVIWNDASVKIMEELHQRGGVKAAEDFRGKIEFDDTRRWFKVTLTGSANLSTFLHESGHAFLEVLRRDALAGDVQSANDLAIVEKWMEGAGKDRTAQLERFARGFETYLMEGKAPSFTLREVFSSVKAWLVYIYRTLSKLDAPLTDDVRGVMDRLVATDDEIQAARKSAGLFPAEMPDMDPAEAAAFKDRYERAVEAAKAEMERNAMSALHRAMTDAQTGIKDEVIAESKKRKDWNAYEFLRTGKTLDETQTLAPEIQGKKLSKKTIGEYVEEGDRRRVKLASLVSEDGLDADAMAPFLGYADGQELVSALLDAPSRAKWVKDEVSRRMAEKYPDSDVATLAEKAAKAVHSPVIDEVLEAELNAFEAKTGKAPTPRARDVLRLAARRRVEEMTAQEMQPGVHLRAEEQYAKEVLAAVAKKDYLSAREARRRQMYHRFMWREVTAAREEVSKIRDYLHSFNDVATQKRIGLAGERYLNSISAIVDGIDLTKQSDKALARRTALETYLQEMEAEGEPVAVDPSLRAELGLKNWRQMSLSEVRAVRDAVKNIETLARLKNKLVGLKKAREFKQTVIRLSEHVRANVGVNFQDGIGEPSWWTKRAEWFRKARYNMTKIEFLCRVLDGGKTAGFAHELIFQPLRDAQNKKFAMSKEITEQLISPFRDMTTKERIRYDKKIEFLGQKIKHRELIALILNLGNEGNKEKALKGFRFTEEQVQSKLDEMRANGQITDFDLDLVQHVWDTIGKLWPEIRDLAQRNTGIAPEAVEPSPLTIGDRTLKGGYYPVVYNRRLSYKAEQIAQRKTGDLFENNFLLPAVEKGFTQSRTKFYAPISLSLDVIPSHVNEVVHYLSHYEAIRAVDKVLASKEVEKAITEGVGREAYSLFRPWLQAIAADGAVHDSTKWYDSVFRRLRLGSSIALLGFKVTTGLKQIFGLSSSAKELGRYTATGAGIFLKKMFSGENPFKEVAEGSPEFANIDATYDRDMAAMFHRLSEGAFSGYGAMKEKLAHMALAWMMLNQKAVNAITWYGAREKALAEGHSDPHAYADSIVAMTQSGGGIKDLAAIQRGSETEKMFTVMYTYFSVMFNQLSESMPNKKAGQKMAVMAARWWWLVTLPALLDAVAAKGVPKDDKDKDAYLEALTLGQFLYASRTVPVAGDALSAFLDDREARYGAWWATLMRGADAAGNAARRGEASPAEIRAMSDLLGAGAGLPVNAARNAMKYLEEFQDGSMEEPVQNLLFRNPSEWE